MSGPRRLGAYEIVRPLGRGGMAEVLLARRAGADGFQREVVIKRILSDYAAEPLFVDMFRDEARITALLRHGNIAQVIEFSEDGGQYFLVLEYVDGTTLFSLLQHARALGRGMPPVVIAYVLSELARALDYAHRKRGSDGALLGIVHRDVSPSNALLSREGEVKLADFGIARARERLSSTMTGNFKGKLSYMAAEALEGGAEPRSDLFALGAVGWEMCVGKPPFEAPTFHERVMRILDGAQGPLSAAAPEAPPALAAIVDQLLQKDRAQRPARASEVTDALGPVIASAARPASELLAEMVSELVPAADGGVPEASAIGRPQVLVIERSATARALLRAALGKDVELIEVEEPEAALDVLTRGSIALVISQHRLSGARTGVDLCIELHAHPRYAEVPFVLTVSDAEPGLEQRALASGVTAVVTKASPQELIKRVRAIVAKLH